MAWIRHIARRKGENLVSAGGLVYRMVNGHAEVAICGRSNPLVWSLPKGTPNPGESLEQTAIREVTEETGLKVQIQSYIDSINYWFVRADDHVRCYKTVHFYLMSSTGGSVSLHDPEFDVVQWVSVSDALKNLNRSNEVNVVKKGLAQLAEKVGTSYGEDTGTEYSVKR
ncbi:MAG: NUDIX hydrolase [Chloroflexi bacterium]|nr:NUDIX hydrolase [Chloroflexota bacterium]